MTDRGRHDRPCARAIVIESPPAPAVEQDPAAEEEQLPADDAETTMEQRQWQEITNAPRSD